MDTPDTPAPTVVRLLPWERQPWDTDESWAAFVAYRDQPGIRRGRYITIKGRPPVDPVKVSWWMANHFWAERVAEYDRHTDALVRKEREALLTQSAREVAADYMASLQDSRDIIRRELAKLRATSEDSSGETVRIRDLVRLLEVSLRADRLIRGESTERVDVGPDLSSLSDEELERRDALLRELEGQGREPAGD